MPRPVYTPAEHAARARAEVLAALDRYVEHLRKKGISSGAMPICHAAFIRLYNAGHVPVKSWVREHFPSLSRNNLRRWDRLRHAAGMGALEGKYGHRTGQSIINTDPTFRAAVAAIFKAEPTLTAPEVLSRLPKRLAAKVSKATMRRHLADLREQGV